MSKEIFSQKPTVFLSCEVLKGLVGVTPKTRLGPEPLFLDAGLHATPKLLHAQVQEQIDRIEEPSVIILGYGLCGNGLHDIRAGKHILIIPRMDDCIAMFMGGREAYLAEHEKEPGTYYLTKGWLQAGTHPLGEYRGYVEKYGMETAEFVMDQQYRHYRRLVFVANHQADLDGFREQALEVAEFCERWGMVYEEILGVADFLLALEDTLAGSEPVDDKFIVIKPGETLKQELFR